MEAISTDIQLNINQKNQDFLSCIRIHFQQIKAYCLKEEILNRNLNISMYVKQCKLERAGIQVQLLWRIDIKSNLIKIQIKIISDQISKSGQTLINQFQNNSDQMYDFVKYFNNQLFSTSQGCFIYHQSGQFALQLTLKGIQFISNPRKMQILLKNRLDNATKQYVAALETIILYYSPLSKNDENYNGQTKESKKQSLNSSCQQIYKHIVFLKYLIDKRRSSQQTSNKQNQIFKNKSVFDNIRFNFGKNQVFSVNYLQLDKDSKKDYQKQYKNEVEHLKKYMKKYQGQNFDRIATQIHMQKQKYDEKEIGRGGFSVIKAAFYTFVPQISFDKTISLNKPTINSPNSVKVERLVKKQIRQDYARDSKYEQKLTEARLCLKNQENFLRFMRNKICPYFAKYFHKSKTQKQAEEFFIRYYPFTMDSVEGQIRQWQKLKSIQDLCMGMFFLHKQKFIHHDLKEQNIVIDKYRRAKIIDFGSILPFETKKQKTQTKSSESNDPKEKQVQTFDTLDGKIFSTPGYYYNYYQAIKNPKILLKYPNIQNYRHHQNTDQYSLGQILKNYFNLQSLVGQNHFLRHNLNYLSRKCKQIDPDNRLTIYEVIVFLRHLMFFYQAKRQSCKLGFDPGYRANVYQQFIGQQQMRIIPQQKNKIEVFSKNSKSLSKCERQDSL